MCKWTLKYTAEQVRSVNTASKASGDLNFEILERLHLRPPCAREHNLNTSEAYSMKSKQQRSRKRCRRYTTPRYKILTWNVEGYHNAIADSPERTIFEDADVVCLTETMSINAINLQAYYTYTQNAKKQARGRPIGGIAIMAKPHLKPILISSETNSLICVRTGFHDPDENCSCKLSEAVPERYHLSTCTQRERKTLSNFVAHIENLRKL